MVEFFYSQYKKGAVQMLAQVKMPMKYINEVQRTSKKGNAYKQIILGDPVAYQQFVFFKHDELILHNLQSGDDIEVTLEISTRGYDMNTDLAAIRKIKSPVSTS